MRGHALPTLTLLAAVSAAPAAAQAPAPGAKPAAAAASPSADLATPELRTFIGGYFSYGAGEISVVESRPGAVPGYRVTRAVKKVAKEELSEQVDVVLDDAGKLALIGFLFADEQRAGKDMTVKSQADLASVSSLVKGLVGPMRIRVTLDPSIDIPGWKGVRVSIDSGYDFYGVPGYVSAHDGAVLLIGSAWDRGRSIPEQRRQRMKVDADPVQGPAGASVTVVEFSDLQCPFCKKRAGDWETLLTKLPPDVKVRRVFKSFPLTSVHPWAFRAASAARCFFEKDPALYPQWKTAVYARQAELSVESLDALAFDFAAAHGISNDELLGCYLKPKTNQTILDEISEGFTLGVRSTPTYFLDGVMVTWAEDPTMEKAIKDQAGAAKSTKAASR